MVGTKTKRCALWLSVVWGVQSVPREEGKIGSKTRRQILQGHLAPNKNSGKKGSSRGIFQKCEPHERSCAPKFGQRSLEETLQQERCARRVAWDVAKNIYQFKNADKATFYTPIEARVMLAPASKSPVEREFVVDSGASMHMMSKKDLSSDELDTLRRSRNPTVVLTARSEVHTNEEAQEHVHDLNRFVAVQILEETLAVLLLGKLCEDHGCSYEWVSGQKPRLTQKGKTIVCKTDKFVPLAVPRLSSSSSSSTSTSQDLSSTSPAQERSDELAPREWCGSPSTQNKNQKEG